MIKKILYTNDKIIRLIILKFSKKLENTQETNDVNTGENINNHILFIFWNKSYLDVESLNLINVMNK